MLFLELISKKGEHPLSFQKAKNNLGWSPKTSLEELIKEMIENDKEEAKKEALLKKSGFNVSFSQE